MNVTGIGRLWPDGKEVSGPLRYAVRIERHGFMTRARGHAMIGRHDAATMIERVDPNSDLVLVLEDAHRWACVLKSTDGDLAGRGEIL